MSNTNPASGGWNANLRRQTMRLAYWTLAWVITMAIATFGPQFIWAESSPLTTAAVVFNMLIGSA